MDDVILPPVEEDKHGFFKTIMSMFGGRTHKDAMNKLATEQFVQLFGMYLQLAMDGRIQGTMDWSSYETMMFLHGLYTNFYYCYTAVQSTYGQTYDKYGWNKVDDKCKQVFMFLLCLIVIG